MSDRPKLTPISRDEALAMTRGEFRDSLAESKPYEQFYLITRQHAQ